VLHDGRRDHAGHDGAADSRIPGRGQDPADEIRRIARQPAAARRRNDPGRLHRDPVQRGAQPRRDPAGEGQTGPDAPGIRRKISRFVGVSGLADGHPRHQRHRSGTRFLRGLRECGRRCLHGLQGRGTQRQFPEHRGQPFPPSQRSRGKNHEDGGRPAVFRARKQRGGHPGTRQRGGQPAGPIVQAVRRISDPAHAAGGPAAPADPGAGRGRSRDAGIRLAGADRGAGRCSRRGRGPGGRRREPDRTRRGGAAAVGQLETGERDPGGPVGFLSQEIQGRTPPHPGNAAETAAERRRPQGRDPVRAQAILFPAGGAEHQGKGRAPSGAGVGRAGAGNRSQAEGVRRPAAQPQAPPGPLRPDLQSPAGSGHFGRHPDGIRPHPRARDRAGFAAEAAQSPKPVPGGADRTGDRPWPDFRARIHGRFPPLSGGSRPQPRDAVPRAGADRALEAGGRRVLLAGQRGSLQRFRRSLSQHPFRHAAESLRQAVPDPDRHFVGAEGRQDDDERQPGDQFRPDGPPGLAGRRRPASRRRPSVLRPPGRPRTERNPDGARDLGAGGPAYGGRRPGLDRHRRLPRQSGGTRPAPGNEGIHGPGRGTLRPGDSGRAAGAGRFGVHGDRLPDRRDAAGGVGRPDVAQAGSGGGAPTAVARRQPDGLRAEQSGFGAHGQLRFLGLLSLLRIRLSVRGGRAARFRLGAAGGVRGGPCLRSQIAWSSFSIADCGCPAGTCS